MANLGALKVCFWVVDLGSRPVLLKMSEWAKGKKDCHRKISIKKLLADFCLWFSKLDIFVVYLQPKKERKI